MRKVNYEKFPTTDLTGYILTGWSHIIDKFKRVLTEVPIITLDMYVGVHESEVFSQISELNVDLILNTRDLFKSEAEIVELTKRTMTDDALFGYVTNLKMIDYFDTIKLAKAKQAIRNCKGSVAVVGSGASLVVQENACIVYADMARWQIQLRYKKRSVTALGLDDRHEPFSIQYKRGYFNDWLICDHYKDTLFEKVSYWLDTHVPNEPKLINRATFFKGVDKTVRKPFRVVPFFAPAPWGGQWMKEVCDLDRNEINYGWCFDCVPEENSLLFNINGIRFELPSKNLVLLKSRELLGESVESRFGKEFPIRFDLLDTVEGGNLSFQVHPTTHFIKQNFGMQYTQDESYYIIDATNGAGVYLGVKNGVDKKAMIADLHSAEKGGVDFNASKYSNKLAIKKHDHFLIPGGTVHCACKGSLILEISATPNLFTFKMWDWGRFGLDGKPRPINVERGVQVINWERDTDYTMKNLVNAFALVAEGEGWIEERTGLHENQFIETRRHRFTKKVIHHTHKSVNVLNLVEGEEAIVESLDGSFEPFIVHFAETFIIPASLRGYTISPYGLSQGEECVTIKAFVRF